MAGRDVFIAGAVRTPVAIGKENGAYFGLHPVDLLAKILDELMTRSGAPKAAVEDVICGIVTPVKEQGANVPRLAVLKAGFPVTVPAVQLNRMCGSSQQAIHFAAQAIASGDMDVVIACGVEMMSTVKMGSDSDLMGGSPSEASMRMASTFPYKLLHQGVSADMIGKKWNLTRLDCDTLAVQSHEKAAKARDSGIFDREILPIKVPKGDKEVTVSKDEGIRFPVDVQKLGQLRTVFSMDGVVTAGNASQISDGAAAVLLISDAAAQKYGLKKRARIVSRAVVGSDPELMLTAPIPSTQLALKKAGLTMDNIDVVEINEAFACVVLAWAKELKPDMKKVNPNGGAMAMGHPLGATGCILMTKLVHELERTGKRYGLQTMCIGHGQGTATIIENLSAGSPKL
eukprot:TRINITY_DN32_c0_g2_i1.p1 TRINITY_DN32_c0_g2~~TRINITY_DN32_c0_g2_i1.p1  ORF type:complete len:400 (+),score=118.35 TRINITY_DN32_c0_g2_i1:73-1272(+)